MESISAEDIRRVRRGSRVVIDETDRRPHLAALLSVLAERTDLSIELRFSLDGMNFASVIPAGYDLTALLHGGVTDNAKLIDEFGARLLTVA